MLEGTPMSALSTPGGACALTIVEARGRILAKRWHPDGTCEQYDKARTVNLHPLPMTDLAALADVLRDLLTQPRRCVVRGEPIDPNRMIGVRRLVHPDPETGEAPTLREVPRRWVALDLDSVPVPGGTDLRDLAACARAVKPRLPRAFHDVSCIVVATASHAIKPGARLRLWYWLSRPTTGTELLEWFKASPVDPVTFRTVQAIYTAAPLFIGCADPLPERLALVPGARGVVTVPAPAMLRPVLVPPAPSLRLGRGDDAARLEGLSRVVRGAAEGSRHRALYWAACRAGEMVAAGAVGAEAAAADLARAAMDGGGRDRRNSEATARDGIRRGKGGAA
jgi:hypothetical protein